MQRIVVLGATSGIAQAFQRVCAAHGKDLLLVARSIERLDALKGDLLARGAKSVVTLDTDLADTTMQAAILRGIEHRMPGFDTVLLAYGTLPNNDQACHSPGMIVCETHTNFVSAAALLTHFAEHFERTERRGCIAAITSVAGDRGRKTNYVYGAAKGGFSIFLEGMRNRLYPVGVNVVTIKPGPVDTPMIANHPDPKIRKMAASPDKVGADIFRALDKGKPGVVYTPRRWKYIMRVVRAIPDRLYLKMGL